MNLRPPRLDLGALAPALAAAFLIAPSVLACAADQAVPDSAAGSDASPTAAGAEASSPAAAGEAPPPAQNGKTQAANAFDGERALMHARDLVAFGPRPVGSDALEETRKYIESTLEGFGYTVERDEFVGQTPVGEIPMANLIAEVPAAAGAPDGPVIILSGHYDTLTANGFEFVGANDAGSSTAILLELGRVFAEHRPPLPVWLVFFDGEEALVSWGPTDSRYGSRHMAERMAADGSLSQIGAMILFDMIGDRDLRFPKDGNSTAWLNDMIWETAADIGYSRQFKSGSQYMEDDHLPFTERGVAAVDLIDWDYGPGNRYWHAPFDTIDKLDASSFQAVGETILTVLPRLAERLTQ